MAPKIAPRQIVPACIPQNTFTFTLSKPLNTSDNSSSPLTFDDALFSSGSSATSESVPISGPLKSGRPFKNSSDDSSDSLSRKKARAIRNRLAAKKSRENKKAAVEVVYSTNAALVQENQRLQKLLEVSEQRRNMLEKKLMNLFSLGNHSPLQKGFDSSNLSPNLQFSAADVSIQKYLNSSVSSYEPIQLNTPLSDDVLLNSFLHPACSDMNISATPQASSDINTATALFESISSTALPVSDDTPATYSNVSSANMILDPSFDQNLTIDNLPSLLNLDSASLGLDLGNPQNQSFSNLNNEIDYLFNLVDPNFTQLPSSVDLNADNKEFQEILNSILSDTPSNSLPSL
ncbi:hypothetical protein AYI70_g6903 [Smittium culicis]|uniref:BZIP domain-containing protein n=1 Tax=Smittium culicis TaxID=133412 RepID=A0A1R1XMV8_9FUNG|nr:hypothetical protein AYI70_g6903 [Smittium culicis]